MRLLTALGLSVALFLSAQPAAAGDEQKLGRAVIESAIPTNHCGVVRFGDPPCQHTYISNPSLLACMGFSLPTTDFQRYLYCLNVLNSTLTPIATPQLPPPVPTPTQKPVISDCLVALGDMKYSGNNSNSSRQFYQIWMHPDCAGKVVNWRIEYPTGKIRTKKAKVFLDGVSQISLPIRTTAVLIWVQADGGESVGCYPQQKWCD